MIIKGLEVCGVGKFATPTRVEGFGPGVNMLAAHNEFGKSTLLKALRAVVFLRHTSKEAWLRDLATTGADVAMSINLDFEAKGQSCRLEKRFLRRASAQLQMGTTLKDGSAADEGAWELLGLKPGSTKPLDKAGFGFLWVAQGTSSEAPDLPDETRNTLSDAINAQIGQVAGGDRARALLKTLKAAIDAQVTSQGRSKTGGDLERVQSEVARLSDDVADAESQLARYDTLLSQLGAAQAALQGALSASQEAEQKYAIEAAQTALQAAQLERASLDGLKAQAERAEMFAQSQIAKVSDLERARAALQSSQTQIEDLTQALAQAAQALNEVTQQKAEAGAALHQARQNRLSASETLRLAELRRDQTEAQKALEGIETLMDEVQSDHEALQAARATSARLAPVAKASGKLAKLEAALIQAQAQARAGATRFSIALLNTAAQTVKLDGATLSGSLDDETLDRSRVIEIETIGTIRLEPGPDTAQSAQAATLAQHELDDALRALGLSDMEAMHAATQDNQAALGLISRLETTLTRSLKGYGSPESLQAQAEQFRAHLAGIESTLQASSLEAVEGEGLSLPDIKASARQAERAEQDAQHDMDLVSSRWQSASEAHLKCEVMLESQLRAHKALSSQGDDAQLSALLADARLEAAHAQAKADVAAQALEAARAQLPCDDQIALLQARVDRLTTALQNETELRHELTGTVRRLEGQVAEAGCDGIEARIAVLREELERARRHEQRISLALNADSRLYHAIKTRLEAEATRFAAPVRAAIAPYLMSVFPNAGLDLGEGLEVKGMDRPGLESRFDFLSTGTQEQIAILVRLALADIMAKSGETPPIILDDALVYADQARREAMFDAIAHAGQSHQIIILTCHSDTFKTLGGRTLRLVS